jgi:uncharacterized repeat protein (TIGR03803 family)
VAFAAFMAHFAHAANFRTIVTFTPPPDGVNPRGGLLLDAAGNFVGTTGDGGTDSRGTVFKLNTGHNFERTTIATLNKLDGDSSGGPAGELIADNAGNLYGATNGGGFNGVGRVFKLDAANNYALSTLTTFSNFTGSRPAAGLLADASGNLYGTTSLGGAAGVGTVFKLTKSSGYALSTLVTFTNT